MTQLPKLHAIVASPSSELLSLPSYWVLGYGATAGTGGRVPRMFDLGLTAPRVDRFLMPES